MCVCLSLLYDETKLLRFQAIFFHSGDPLLMITTENTEYNVRIL